MSPSDRSSTAKGFQMPDEFSFGLEERGTTLGAIKLELDDDEYSHCSHEWFKRDDSAQTLAHEGKTILECRGCNRTVAVYDWKLQNS